MKICPVDGCNRGVYARGWCARHYEQMRRHGKILKRSNRDPNEFVIDQESQVVRMAVYDPVGNEHSIKILFDVDDLEKIIQRRWFVDARLRPRSDRPKPWILLHNWLWPEVRESGKVIDHINGVTYDCRRSNMRAVTNSQNMQNSKGYGVSGVKGVSPHGSGFQVRIREFGKDRTFGTYQTLEEAAKVSEREARRIQGEFAFEARGDFLTI